MTNTMSTATPVAAPAPGHGDGLPTADTAIIPAAASAAAPAPETPTAAAPRRERAAAVAVGVVPAVAMAAVSTIGSGRSLWQDEYIAWYASRLSASDLWRLLNHIDMSKACYFAGLHLWINLVGDSPTAMRAPSIAAMAVAAGATALIGRRLFGELAGILAGLLLVAVPALSRYGSEISSYAFVVAAVAVSTLLLTRAYERPTTARWFTYGASVTVIGYVHFVALLVLIPHWLIYHRAVQSHPDDDAPDWAVTAWLGFIPVAPLLWVSHGQASAISWIRMSGAQIAAYPTNLFMSAAVAGLVCGTAITGGLLLFARRVHRWKMLLLVLWAVMPPILGALTFRWLHVFLPRYFLFTVPAFALLFTAVVTSMLRRARMHRLVVATVATALVALVGVVGYPAQRSVRHSPTDGEPDLRSALATLAVQQKPDDGIAYAGADTRLYARQAVAYELRGKPKPRDVFEQTSPVARAFYGAIECAKPAECLGRTTRIWLLSTSTGSDPTAQMSNKAIADLLRKQFTAGPVQRFRQVRLVLLTRKPPAPPAPPAKGAAKVAPAKPARPAPTATKQGGTR